MINGANTKTLISCAADLCLCFCICKKTFYDAAYNDTSLNNVNTMGEIICFLLGTAKGHLPARLCSLVIDLL